MSEELLDRSADVEIRRDEQQIAHDDADWRTFIGLMKELRSSFRLIGFAGLVSMAIAASIAFLIPPRYTSVASFIPPSASNTSGAAAIAGQLSQISGVGAGSFLGSMKSPGDLYVGILGSRSVQSELVKHFDLLSAYKVQKESQAEKRLASNTAFDVDTKNSIVTLKVIGPSPAQARDLATAYLDALRKINSRLALTESSQRRLFFEQQLLQEKNALEDSEIALKRTEEQSGLIAPAGQTTIEIQTIAQTRAQESLLQVQLSALRQSSTEQNPEIIRLQSEIEDLHGQLHRLESSDDKSAGGAIPASRVPEAQLAFVRRDRDVKYHEVLFGILSKQYEAARIDEAHDAPLLQILDPPSYPDTRSSPPTVQIVLAGLVGGVLFACVWVLLRPRLFRSVNVNCSAR